MRKLPRKCSIHVLVVIVLRLGPFLETGDGDIDFVVHAFNITDYVSPTPSRIRLNGFFFFDIRLFCCLRLGGFEWEFLEFWRWRSLWGDGGVSICDTLFCLSLCLEFFFVFGVSSDFDFLLLDFGCEFFLDVDWKVGYEWIEHTLEFDLE